MKVTPSKAADWVAAGTARKSGKDGLRQTSSGETGQNGIALRHPLMVLVAVLLLVARWRR